MKDLYVYDFDKTLISYDTFRRFLWHLCNYRPIAVISLILLRKMRILSSCSLKEKITKMVERSTFLKRKTEAYAKMIEQDIEWPRNNGTIVVVTASPMVYMKYIVDNKSYQMLCSDYIGEDYIEMYGKMKAKYLFRMYPSSDYRYIYASSDSKSDLCWMKEFQEYNLIE